ncbi:MAG TPA: N-acetylneuraminate synthase family protein [Xanthobacteraceae bacterium]|nr:N-acetylneuraminate synthase family protein [Xanthobacteraceae bacterium]
MARELWIDGAEISDASDCYVIAEIGHNHQGSLDECKRMFAVAKECGANAVKLQKRDNRALYTKAMYDSPYLHRNSYGATYGEHREKLEFGRSEYEALIRHAKELGITFFSTAFDIPSADFLAALDMPAYKIASGDLTNIPLLRHVAKLGKPMIISTGGGTMEDVVRAYYTIMPLNRQLAILQCTSGYPAEFEELNLKVIQTFRDRFPETVIGLSSHDNGIAMALVGYVMGARIVEKHFTLNRAAKGTDHAFSLTPEGMHRMVRDLRRARIAVGDGVKRTYESEKGPLYKMAKALVAARDLPAGHVLTPADLTFKSPSNGLPPYEYDNVLGMRLTTAVKADDSIKYEILEPAEPARRVAAAQ